MQDEQAFDKDDRCRSEVQDPWRFQVIVERVFRPLDDLSSDQFKQVMMKGLLVDGFRPVKIRHPLVIGQLFLARTVVVVL